MAEFLVYRCDRCGKDNISKAGRIFVKTGSEHNGVETVTTGLDLDLCQKCAVQELATLIRAEAIVNVPGLIDRCTAKRGSKY